MILTNESIPKKNNGQFYYAQSHKCPKCKKKIFIQGSVTKIIPQQTLFD